MKRSVAPRVLALAAAIAVVFASVPAAAQEKVVTLDDYIALLDGASLAAPKDSQALQELRLISSVTLHGGTSFTVFTSWPAPGNASLKPRLETALAEARARRDSYLPDNRDPRSVAREITSSDEFHRKQSLIDRIKEAIDRFFNGLDGNELPEPEVDLPNAPYSQVSELISVIVLITAIVLLALFVWRRLRAINRSEKEENDEESEEIWDIGPADPVKLEEMAFAAADNGHYSDAVRAFYVANLLRLDAKGVIRFKASDTNGVFRRSLLERLGPIVREFDTATQVFERVHYGDHVASATDWETTKAAWQRVWSGVAA